jgi:hypothetical protein
LLQNSTYVNDLKDFKGAGFLTVNVLSFPKQQLPEKIGKLWIYTASS